MGKSNKSEEEEQQELEVEFSISMHCNACERKVAKVISKIKGVEKFITDMRNHRVVVTGRFKPEKVMKKLKKKTGKRVEIVIPVEGEGEGGDENGEADGNEFLNGDEDFMPLLMEEVEDEEVGYWCEDDPVFTMFSDENANACFIM